MTDLTQESEIIEPTIKVGTDTFIPYLRDKLATQEGKLDFDIDLFEKSIEMPEEITTAILDMYEKKATKKSRYWVSCQRNPSGLSE